MEVVGRWLGRAARPQDLRPGDYFLVSHRGQQLLVLVVQEREGDANDSGVVLAEFGRASGDPVPRLIYISGLQPETRAFRVLDGRLEIGATQQTAADIAPSTDTPKNGSLLTFDNGTHAVVTKQPPYGIQLWQLSTGARLDPASAGPYVVTDTWSVSWPFGEEDFDLCNVIAQ